MRQHAEHAAPARAPAHHGQPPLLGRRHARRRIPVRSRQRTGARTVRGRQTRVVLRHHRAGSGALTGEADCRTMGPGGRRIPGGELPCRVDRVERAIPRPSAALLARRRRPDLGTGESPGGQQRPLRAERPPAVCQHQLHHLATTAERWASSSPTAPSKTKPTAKTTSMANPTT